MTTRGAWGLMLILLAASGAMGDPVSYYLEQYNYTSFPELASMGSSEAGLLSILARPEGREFFNLTWVPEQFHQSPGANDLVNAAMAYLFMYPAMQMDVVRFQVLTRLALKDGPPYNLTQYNTFFNTDALANSSFDASAPNADTVYSSANLDLSQGPLIVSLPSFEALRWWSIVGYDAYSNIDFVLGSSHNDSAGGDFLIYWAGEAEERIDNIIASHPRVIQKRFPTSHKAVYFINRLLVVNATTDIPLIAGLQVQQSITFAEKNKTYVPPPMGSPTATIPVEYRMLQGRYAMFNEESNATNTLEYFYMAGALLARYPPTPSGLEQPWLNTFQTLGLNSSGFFPETLSADKLDALDYGVTLATQILWAKSQLWGERMYSPWQYSLRCGRYGQSEFLLNSYFAKYFYMLNLIEDAAYLAAFWDSDMKPLTGTGGAKYQIVVPATLPVVPTGFWSLTVYNDYEDLAANPINRYTIGDRTTGLVYNPDGTFNVTLSYEQPTDATELANWLPIPDARWYIVLRLYDNINMSLGEYSFVPLTRLV